MGRFDDPALVEAWRSRGEWPAIHRQLVGMIHERAVGRRFLDLCASTGLLGRQLTTLGFNGWAIEAKPGDPNAYDAMFGVVQLKLTPATLALLHDAIDANGADVVVARRCLPELEDAGVTPAMLADVLASAGVTELFVQGRRPTPNAVHRLATVELEVEALVPAGWSPVVVAGECAYLRHEGLALSR